MTKDLVSRRGVDRNGHAYTRMVRPEATATTEAAAVAATPPPPPVEASGFYGENADGLSTFRSDVGDPYLSSADRRVAIARAVTAGLRGPAHDDATLARCVASALTDASWTTPDSYEDTGASDYEVFLDYAGSHRLDDPGVANRIAEDLDTYGVARVTGTSEEDEDDYPTYREVVEDAVRHGDAWAPAEMIRLDGEDLRELVEDPYAGPEERRDAANEAVRAYPTSTSDLGRALYDEGWRLPGATDPETGPAALRALTANPSTDLGRALEEAGGARDVTALRASVSGAREDSGDAYAAVLDRDGVDSFLVEHAADVVSYVERGLESGSFPTREAAHAAIARGFSREARDSGVGVPGESPEARRLRSAAADRLSPAR